MSAAKANILAQLQKDILSLQGYKPIIGDDEIQIDLGPLKYAFPNARFPLAAIHEFICENQEDIAATIGFISAIAGSLMQKGGVCLWISTRRKLFPPSLKQLALDPDKIIFIDFKKERDALWAIEEALKCEGLVAVIGEIKEFSFMVSRRFQLAVEKSNVTGFMIRTTTKQMNTTAAIARWRIRSLPSVTVSRLPGVGFPKWSVNLLKVRNGKPGSWEIEWVDDNFKHQYQTPSIEEVKKRKAG